MSALRSNSLTTLRAEVRFQVSALLGNWTNWFILLAFTAISLILRTLTTEEPTSSGVLDGLHLGMFVTVVPVILGAQATLLALTASNREMSRMRLANEAIQQLSRALIIGTFGTLLVIAVAAGLTGQAHAAPHMSVILPWLLIIWLINILCAKLGGTTAAAFADRPLIATGTALALWVAWQYLSTAIGPAFPDVLLRVVRWDPLFGTTTAEPLYTSLILSSLAAIAALLVASTILITYRERTPLLQTATGTRSSLLATMLSCLVLAGVFVAQESRRQDQLHNLVGTEALNQLTDITWHPEQPALHAVGPDGEITLSGPARAAAVSNAEHAQLSPYISSNGALVPIERLQVAGSYEATLNLPEGWEAHGCTFNPVTSPCTGTSTQADWLLIIPAGTTQHEESSYQTVAPQTVAARQVYKEATRQLLADLGIRNISFLPTAASEPVWFSSRALSIPASFGDRIIAERNAVHAAAEATSLWIVRETNPSLQNPPMQLLAILDRLALELSGITRDPTEPARRAGEATQEAPVYPLLPQFANSEFNEWWLWTHQQLVAQETTASSLLIQLAQVNWTDTPDGEPAQLELRHE